MSRSAQVSPPPAIAAVIARVQRHLAGDLQDFADLAYDWSRVTAFQSRVLRAVLAVEPGRTATYGELARALVAKPGTARAIGGAVGANPWPLLIPCHRILGAGGRLTGYSAPGGLATKRALLVLEGVELPVS
jgi:methylated-DNA-[protein]-cysteine S-methyltransferase